jgi:hypothetical protein
MVQIADEQAVIAGRLTFRRLKDGQDRLDAIKRLQDERHCRRADIEVALPETAQNILGRMRDRFEPGQAKEAAGSLDRMNQPEDVSEQAGIVRLLFEPHQLDVKHGDVLCGLGQKLA